MNSMSKLIALVVVPLALTACAALDSEKHSQHDGGAPASNTGHRMAMMQDNMLRMHEQMHRIRDARDPTERARLMQEHEAFMQEHMKMMGGHGKGGMMGAPAGK